LPGPEQICFASHTATRVHSLDPLARLKRPDQDGRANPDRLAYGVQQRVNAIRAIHVCDTRRAKQCARARREANESVAGGLAVVIGLSLNNPAGHSAVLDDAAEEITGNSQYRAIVKICCKPPARPQSALP